uniref:Guanine nucleotide-binding protein subunit beta-like protein n=1 Tax=Trypanosoma vivax (strain Y486) TaxID=1055687 RepID=G0U895_TRYVY|nr:conserved hypothetical protein [Trypanosoma vivax Y486]
MQRTTGSSHVLTDAGMGELDKMFATAWPVRGMTACGHEVWLALSNSVEARNARTLEVVHQQLANRSSGESVEEVWAVITVFIQCTALHVWMGLSSGAIEVYDAQSFVLSHRRTGHAGGVYCLAEFGGYVYSGSSDFKVGQWDAEGAQLLRMLHGHSNYVRCLYAEGNAIVSGSDDCTVRVWDVGSGTTQLTGHFHGHAGVSALCRVGVTMWSGDDGGRVVAWRLDTCEALHVLQVHSGRVTSLRKVGSRVYSGGADGVIVVYDAEESRVLHRIDNHKGARVTSFLAPSQLQRFCLWSSSSDKVIRCWYHDEYVPLTGDQERFTDPFWYSTGSTPYREFRESLLKHIGTQRSALKGMIGTNPYIMDMLNLSNFNDVNGLRTRECSLKDELVMVKSRQQAAENELQAIQGRLESIDKETNVVLGLLRAAQAELNALGYTTLPVHSSVPTNVPLAVSQDAGDVVANRFIAPAISNNSGTLSTHIYNNVSGYAPGSAGGGMAPGQAGAGGYAPGSAGGGMAPGQAGAGGGMAPGQAGAAGYAPGSAGGGMAPGQAGAAGYAPGSAGGGMAPGQAGAAGYAPGSAGGGMAPGQAGAAGYAPGSAGGAMAPGQAGAAGYAPGSAGGAMAPGQAGAAGYAPGSAGGAMAPGQAGAAGYAPGSAGGAMAPGQAGAAGYAPGSAGGAMAPGQAGVAGYAPGSAGGGMAPGQAGAAGYAPGSAGGGMAPGQAGVAGYAPGSAGGAMAPGQAGVAGYAPGSAGGAMAPGQAGVAGYAPGSAGGGMAPGQAGAAGYAPGSAGGAMAPGQAGAAGYAPGSAGGGMAPGQAGAAGYAPGSAGGAMAPGQAGVAAKECISTFYDVSDSESLRQHHKCIPTASNCDMCGRFRGGTNTQQCSMMDPVRSVAMECKSGPWKGVEWTNKNVGNYIQRRYYGAEPSLRAPALEKRRRRQMRMPDVKLEPRKTSGQEQEKGEKSIDDSAKS